MRKGVWEMLARLPILTFDASSFKMAETLKNLHSWPRQQVLEWSICSSFSF
jgi:hypothetical protein